MSEATILTTTTIKKEEDGGIMSSTATKEEAPFDIEKQEETSTSVPNCSTTISSTIISSVINISTNGINAIKNVLGSNSNNKINDTANGSTTATTNNATITGTSTPLTLGKDEGVPVDKKKQETTDVADGSSSTANNIINNDTDIKAITTAPVPITSADNNNNTASNSPATPLTVDILIEKEKVAPVDKISMQVTTTDESITAVTSSASNVNSNTNESIASDPASLTMKEENKDEVPDDKQQQQEEVTDEAIGAVSPGSNTCNSASASDTNSNNAEVPLEQEQRASSVDNDANPTRSTTTTITSSGTEVPIAKEQIVASSVDNEANPTRSTTTSSCAEVPNVKEQRASSVDDEADPNCSTTTSSVAEEPIAKEQRASSVEKEANPTRSKITTTTITSSGAEVPIAKVQMASSIDSEANPTHSTTTSSGAEVSIAKVQSTSSVDDEVNPARSTTTSSGAEVPIAKVQRASSVEKEANPTCSTTTTTITSSGAEVSISKEQIMASSVDNETNPTRSTTTSSCAEVPNVKEQRASSVEKEANPTSSTTTTITSSGAEVPMAKEQMASSVENEVNPTSSTTTSSVAEVPIAKVQSTSTFEKEDNSTSTGTSNSPTNRTTNSTIPMINGMESRLERVGDPTMGMTLVYPPTITDAADQSVEHPAVVILRQIDAELKKPTTKRRFYNLVQEEIHQLTEELANPPLIAMQESARMIQGGRMEIFLRAKDKSSLAFDSIIGDKLVDNAKEIVLEYCQQQADKDPRLQDSDGDYEYDNFSLLVSLGKRPAQAPHLDLVHPNFQFGVVLSDQTAGTLFVEHQDKLGRVANIEDLTQLWNQNLAFADAEYGNTIPPKIVEALHKDDGAKLLLRYFGDTLIPEASLISHMTSRDRLPAGTLAALPGGVVHAGPSSSGVRAILFFSGAPADKSTVDPYLPDSQYNGVTLMGHLLSILWRRDNMGTFERKYLLRRLVQYIEGTSAKEAWAQFGEGVLQDVVKTITKNKYKTTQDDYIKEKALVLEMVYGNDPFSQTETMIGNPNEFDNISKDNLYTNWEGLEFNVKVYRRRTDQKIILRFLTSGTDSESPDDYEGHLPHEHLQLSMRSKRALFDGTNGTLLDTDSEPILIYENRKPQAKVVRTRKRRQSTSPKKSRGLKRKAATASPKASRGKKRKAGKSDFLYGSDDMESRNKIKDIKSIEGKMKAFLEVEKTAPGSGDMTNGARRWCSQSMFPALRCLRKHHGGNVKKYAKAWKKSKVNWTMKQPCRGFDDECACV